MRLRSRGRVHQSPLGVRGGKMAPPSPGRVPNMNLIPVAPGVFKRLFEMGRFVDKLYAEWSRVSTEDFGEFYENGVRGFDRDEVLEQFPPKARRLAR